MAQVFRNNAFGSLAAELSASGTLATLATGQGARFPAPTGGDYFLATLILLDENGAETAWEIVKCTARSTDNLTIQRAQEGTTARTWPAGTRIEMRVTAGTLDIFTDTEQAAAAAPVQSVAGKTGAVTLTKSDVGLGNVDNTSDANKPISAATQTALAAIASQNTGATAPSPTYPHQFWADTTSGKLKMRNGANTAWIDVMTLADAKALAAASADSATSATNATNATNLTGASTANIPTSALGSGTADSTTFLRGDRTWVTLSVSPEAIDAAIQSAIVAEQTARQQAIQAEQTARQAMDQQLLALIAAAL